MSVLEKVYDKFSNLELYYSFVQNEKSRKDFIIELFGGNVDEGAAILTEAIICENPSTTEELEQFSFVKDLFNFFIKNIDIMSDEITSFEEVLANISLENEAFGDLDAIMNAITKIVRPDVDYRCIAQKDLYNEYNALHYMVTPDTVRYVTLHNCFVHKILSMAHAEICARMYGSSKELIVGATYQKRKTDFTKVNKSDMVKLLSST